MIVGPSDSELLSALPKPGGWELLPAGETLMESLFTWLGHLRESPAVLCTTADLPLLRTVAVTEFLQACARAGGTARGLFWSMVPEHAFTGHFARASKGFNRLRDIAVCHGNLYLLRPELFLSSALGSRLYRLYRLYRARKSSIRAVLVFGPQIGLAYLVGVHLLRRLTLERMAGIVSRNLGLEVVPILLERPEIALDVDEPRTYDLVRELLENGPSDPSCF